MEETAWLWSVHSYLIRFKDYTTEEESTETSSNENPFDWCWETDSSSGREISRLGHSLRSSSAELLSLGPIGACRSANTSPKTWLPPESNGNDAMRLQGTTLGRWRGSNKVVTVVSACGNLIKLLMVLWLYLIVSDCIWLYLILSLYLIVSDCIPLCPLLPRRSCSTVQPLIPALQAF